MLKFTKPKIWRRLVQNKISEPSTRLRFASTGLNVEIVLLVINVLLLMANKTWEKKFTFQAIIEPRNAFNSMKICTVPMDKDVNFFIVEQMNQQSLKWLLVAHQRIFHMWSIWKTKIYGSVITQIVYAAWKRIDQDCLCSQPLLRMRKLQNMKFLRENVLMRENTLMKEMQIQISIWSSLMSEYIQWGVNFNPIPYLYKQNKILYLK